MGNLSIKLRQMARKNGLCDEWFEAWDDNTDNTTLLEKYKRGIDFSIEHDWISNEFIKSNWDKSTLQENGVFVDDKNILLKNKKGIFIINGESDIKMYFDGYDTADIYVRHLSKLEVIVQGHAKIRINIYDNSEIISNCNEDGRIYIYKHTDFGDIKDVGTCGSLIRYYKI